MCYSVVMKIQRAFWLAVGLIFVAAASASAFSVIEDVHAVQPFDSEERLAQWTFDFSIPESQRKFAETCEIQLVTVGRGDPLYAWFGHSSLVVVPPEGYSVMFDYGIFDFKQDHFYRNFALGRLYYSVMSSAADWRLEDAVQEQRDVRVQTLDLPPSAKLAVIEFLNANVQPENNTYLYHHFKDNCATRIRDIINAATGGAFKTWAQEIPGTGTYRQHVMRHTISDPIVDWGLNFLQSGEIDHRITLWDEMFLPEILEQAAEDFSWTWPDGTTRPLVQSTEIRNDTNGLNVRPADKTETPHVFLPSLLVGFILGGIGLGLLWWYRRHCNKEYGYALPRFLFGFYNGVLCLVLGIVSSVLLFMMTCSTHDVTWYNENIIFANPWLLVMAVQSFVIAFSDRGDLHGLQRGFRALSVLGLVLMILKGTLPDIFHQANFPILAVLFPYYALQGWVIRFAPRKRPKRKSREERRKDKELTKEIRRQNRLRAEGLAETAHRPADTDVASPTSASSQAEQNVQETDKAAEHRDDGNAPVSDGEKT